LVRPITNLGGSSFFATFDETFKSRPLEPIF
jgi:hypothetical protein